MKSPAFATSPSTQPARVFARLPTVMQATGLGRSTIYRLVAGAHGWQRSRARLRP